MGYPTSVQSFTTKNQGDTIQNSHVNDLQTEVNAIENGLLNGLQHGLTISTGGLTVSTGALTINQGQIVFPATQVASASTSTLDDYREGTWTPVIGGSSQTSGQTYSYQSGRYIKIGRQVTASFSAVLSAKGTISSNVQIQGLPFASVADTFSASLRFVALNTSWVNVIGTIEASSSRASVTGSSVAATANTTKLVTGDIGNTTDLRGVFTYLTSS